MSISSNNNSWTLTNVPIIIRNPERYQERLERRSQRKTLKKPRPSHSRTRTSNYSTSNRRSHSRSKSIHPSNIHNTVTNWSNFDPENYNDAHHGPQQFTVEDQLLDAIIYTEGSTISKVCHHIKAILDKIAQRPKGDYYPKNKLTLSAVEKTIKSAIINEDEGDYDMPMSIAILDTLLSHPLFKNVQIREFNSKTRTYTRRPYDVLNQALILAVTNTNDMSIIRYLIQDRGANPAANHFMAIITALLMDKYKMDRGQPAEKDHIIAYFMDHPFMQKWDTLHQAVEYIKASRYSPKEKRYLISFFVYSMFALLKDPSDNTTKERIIIMHDQYREYMEEEEKKEINRLYADITMSLNKKLPSNIHKHLSTFGGRRKTSKKNN